jgi:hypothetical protein
LPWVLVIGESNDAGVVPILAVETVKMAAVVGEHGSA